MSNVTNLILTGMFGNKEIGKIERLITKIDAGIHNITLRDNSDGAWGSVGTKAMESNVYLMAFNYFPIDRFVEGLNKILREAEREAYAQLFVMKENEDFFHSIILDCKKESE